MRIVWSAEAAVDLERILDFIARSSLSGAAAVAVAVDTTLASIRRFPYAGRLDAKTGCRERLAGRYPPLIVYLVHDDGLEIIAVFHTSRDPASKRLPK